MKGAYRGNSSNSNPFGIERRNEICINNDLSDPFIPVLCLTAVDPIPPDFFSYIFFKYKPAWAFLTRTDLVSRGDCFKFAVVGNLL